MRSLLTYALAGAALVFNPFFACDSSPAFSYGLPEIEAAIAGTWEATITRDFHTETVKFRMEPATASAGEKHSSLDVVRRAAACSQRTLVKSAHACIDETEVPLILTALDNTTRKLSGSFRVMSTVFNEGHARLDIGDVALTVRVLPSGEVRSVLADEDSVAAKVVHAK
jgi:hypothetical protein